MSNRGLKLNQLAPLNNLPDEAWLYAVYNDTDYKIKAELIIPQEKSISVGNGLSKTIMDYGVNIELTPSTQQALEKALTAVQPTDLPALHPIALSGDYTLLENLPSFHTVALSGQYGDLSGLPNLHQSALSGNYEDLDNVPNLDDMVEGTGIKRIVTLTENQYQALETKEEETLYIIKDYLD